MRYFASTNKTSFREALNIRLWSSIGKYIRLFHTCRKTAKEDYHEKVGVIILIPLVLTGCHPMDSQTYEAAAGKVLVDARDIPCPIVNSSGRKIAVNEQK